jgi:hypothetical protein
MMNREFTGALSESYISAGHWISEELPDGCTVLVSHQSMVASIYFFSRGRFAKIGKVPQIRSDRKIKESHMDDHSNIIFLSSRYARNLPENYICVLTEKQLFAKLEKGLSTLVRSDDPSKPIDAWWGKKDSERHPEEYVRMFQKVDYIAIGGRRNYLSRYFDMNRTFEKLKEFNGGEVKLYQVVGSESLESFTPMVSNYLILYLTKLRKYDPNKYDWYVDDFFRPVRGWSREEVNKIACLSKNGDSREFTFVENGKLY